MEKILIITDVWDNISGVVTSLRQIKSVLERQNYEVVIIHSGDFQSFSLPTYKEIKLALVTPNSIAERIKEENPDYIHIATEGTLGVAARQACVKNNWQFTTYYHTDLPEYVRIRLKTFHGTTYRYLRWFHSASARTLVSTIDMKNRLEKNGFKEVALAQLGVDTNLFMRNLQAPELNFPKPIFVYLGRIAPEKNLESFLVCKLPGTKLVIGDGPFRIYLEDKYAGQAVFVGYKTGQELVDILSKCDICVIPSKTETLGLAALEAMSCGLPVAAYDAPGLRNIITNGIDGFTGDDLEVSAIECLKLDRQKPREKAMQFSMTTAVSNFLEKLIKINE